MNSDELKERTRRFALEIIRLTTSLSNTQQANVISRQIVRSGTSVGANYRAACRARSKADFVLKIGVVEEEADETQYWLELLLAARIGDTKPIEALLAEANELVAIFTATGRTAKLRNKPPDSIRDWKSDIRDSK
ncbi:MAG TPA: four helix bundle protein [Phototrophicaceae bacterium]|nr:four helix bundle protein [Phototrophicaceae bacterium]